MATQTPLERIQLAIKPLADRQSVAIASGDICALCEEAAMFAEHLLPGSPVRGYLAAYLQGSADNQPHEPLVVMVGKVRALAELASGEPPKNPEVIAPQDPDAPPQSAGASASHDPTDDE